MTSLAKKYLSLIFNKKREKKKEVELGRIYVCYVLKNFLFHVYDYPLHIKVEN